MEMKKKEKRNQQLGLALKTWIQPENGIRSLNALNAISAGFYLVRDKAASRIFLKHVQGFKLLLIINICFRK